MKRGKAKPDPALYKPSFSGTFDNFYKTNSSKKNVTKPWGSACRFRHYDK